jgi:glutathionyl-hydroquinone reductase
MTGENFKEACWQKSEGMKPRLIVDKETEKSINAEVKRLQNDLGLLYNDDSISDEDLDIISKEYQNKINNLIDSMYETKHQAVQRYLGK